MPLDFVSNSLAAPGHRRRLLFALALLCASAAPPAIAQQAKQPGPAPVKDNAVFVFGGQFESRPFGNALLPFLADYEGAYVIGGGYQRTLWNLGNDWYGGAEVGLAARHGANWSGEAWAGVFARYDGYVLNDTLKISPSLTFGLSAVSGTVGTEARRVKKLGHADTILYYLSPEIAVSLVDQPDWEVFWRVQHRSGGFGTIADIDASNAETLGIRHRF